MAFHLRPETPADFPRMVEIMRDQLPSPPAVEDLQRAHDKRVPGTIDHRLVAVSADGVVIGYGGAEHIPGGTREGHFRIWVRVDRAHRGQGVGSALYQEAERFALGHQPKALEGAVRDDEPESIAFAEGRGFAREHHIFESQLDLATFDPSQFQAAVERAEAAGIRFVSLADYPQDDATTERLLDFYWELAKDQPDGDEMPRPTLALWKHMVEGNPYWDPRGVIFAVDGERWAGLAIINRTPDGSYYHSFTGIQREYRGRGLALALKMATVQYALSKGARLLRTNNHSANQRMLAVNRKMGYTPQPGIYRMVRKLG